MGTIVSTSSRWSSVAAINRAVPISFGLNVVTRLLTRDERLTLPYETITSFSGTTTMFLREFVLYKQYKQNRFSIISARIRLANIAGLFMFIIMILRHVSCRKTAKKLIKCKPSDPNLGDIMQSQRYSNIILKAKKTGTCSNEKIRKKQTNVE